MPQYDMIHSITDMGKDLSNLAAEFSVAVLAAKKDYDSKILELVKKYNIPENKINELKAVLLHPMAAQLFGYSDEFQKEVENIRQENILLRERTGDIEKNLIKLLK